MKNVFKTKPKKKTIRSLRSYSECNSERYSSAVKYSEPFKLTFQLQLPDYTTWNEASNTLFVTFSDNFNTFVKRHTFFGVRRMCVDVPILARETIEVAISGEPIYIKTDSISVKWN